MTLRSLVLASALLGATALSANAAVVKATQGFADIGAPSVNTGDINTATTFTIDDLITTKANSGVLAGMPSQSDFLPSPITFSTSSGTSLTFSDTVFGTFASSTITELSNATTPGGGGAVAIYVLGNWTPGTYGSVTGGPFPASFTISFTQNPAHSGSISDSGTFSVPPAGGIPELSTWAMMGFGFAGLGFAAYRTSRKTADFTA